MEHNIPRYLPGTLALLPLGEYYTLLSSPTTQTSQNWPIAHVFCLSFELDFACFAKKSSFLFVGVAYL